MRGEKENIKCPQKEDLCLDQDRIAVNTHLHTGRDLLPLRKMKRSRNARKRSTAVRNGICKFYEAGNCRKGTNCRFIHEEADREDSCDQRLSKISRKEEEKKEEVFEEMCSICLESKIDVYGLLIGCDHIFCMTCISSWRNGANSRDLSRTELEAKRSCPTCRQHSDFVISSKRYVIGLPKEQLIQERLFERQRTPCRYWTMEKRCKFVIPSLSLSLFIMSNLFEMI
jgi:hypothetical protein